MPDGIAHGLRQFAADAVAGGNDAEGLAVQSDPDNAGGGGMWIGLHSALAGPYIWKQRGKIIHR